MTDEKKPFVPEDTPRYVIHDLGDVRKIIESSKALDAVRMKILYKTPKIPGDIQTNGYRVPVRNTKHQYVDVWLDRIQCVMHCERQAGRFQTYGDLLGHIATFAKELQEREQRLLSSLAV